jgi:hypothetical protein
MDVLARRCRVRALDQLARWMVLVTHRGRRSLVVVALFLAGQAGTEAPPLKFSSRDAAWWLRHYVADALKQSNLAMVTAGGLS